MNLHNLKIAWRSLLKYKVNNLVNVLGLSLGMSCCLLIMLFVQEELSFDTYYEDADQVFRLTYNININSQEIYSARAPITLAPLIKDFFPEVEEVARVFPRSASVYVDRESGNSQSRWAFEEDQVLFADSGLLSILPFEFVSGEATEALDHPYSVVISESIAEKYFKGREAVGLDMMVQGDHPFKVSGVFKDFPSNSHIHPELVFHFDNMYDVEAPDVGEGLRVSLPQNWMITHSLTYVRIKEGTHIETLNQRFKEFLDIHGDERIREIQNFSFTPVADIHLKSFGVGSQIEPVGRMMYIWIFSGIAFITLLIACINFINLSTAGYIRRAKEVGIRKVLGAEKSQLVKQFLGESFLVTAIAFICALGWSLMLLPKVNELTGKTFEVGDLMRPELLIGMVILFLFAALLSGSYPSFFIANFPILKVLKGKNPTNPGRKISLRKVLVVIQFTASVALMIGTLALYQQVRLLTERPLGFNQDQIMTLQLFSQNLNNLFGGVDGPMRQRLNTFEEEMLKHPNIEAITLSSNAMGVGLVSRNVVPDGFTSEDRIIMPVLSVDYDFADVYGLEIIAGRHFGKSYGTDHTSSFIVNEKAVENFDWGSPAEAIGKSINREGKVGQVVGVIKDFHHQALSQPLSPVLLEVTPNVFSLFSVKVLAGNIGETIAFMEDMWGKFFPNKVFQYNFLNTTIEEQYNAESRFSSMIFYFSILAIFISCLGLFSLSLFMAIDRSKEVAIRKVLGATTSQLLRLLSGGFLRLIVIGTVIAWPIAYWGLTYWLEDYAFKIPISIGLFVLPTLLIVGIALLTIAYQTWSTAQTQPVEALRDE